MAFRLQHQIQTEDYVTSITPSPSQPLLLAPCASGSIKVLDPSTLACAATLQTTSPISEVVFGPSAANTVYVGGMDGSISLFDMRTMSPVARLDAGASVLSISLNAAGTVLAAGTELAEKAGPEGEDVARLLMCLINLYNITGDLSEEDSLYQVIKSNSISKIGFFGPQYEYIFAQTHVETYGLYKFEEAETVKEFGDVRTVMQGTGGGFALDYLVDTVFDAPSGRLYLVVGTQSGNLGILNVSLDSMEVVFSLNGGHQDIVRGVHWNIAQRMLVSGGEDGVVSLWRNV
ncbi:hypothetical protein CcCBS67573_g00546 [Chytriomyces confervae]|uniref:Uncharacterized protein n=1 Tax=Chytriomyces confervae TaxID=246404 RepID=A0A507FP10_9FUNG|nr:hypothetical protein CcCBS67573_g00546 [Chytriomyces confervae]